MKTPTLATAVEGAMEERQGMNGDLEGLLVVSVEQAVAAPYAAQTRRCGSAG
ncbi:MAG: hypothetical protein R3D03_01540 [Geminicoccaceae bacterium]